MSTQAVAKHFQLFRRIYPRYCAVIPMSQCDVTPQRTWHETYMEPTSTRVCMGTG